MSEAALFAKDPHRKKHEHELAFPGHKVLYWKCRCADQGCKTAAVACSDCEWRCENQVGYAEACLVHHQRQNN